MTDTSKDKIRVERYKEFKNQYNLNSNKFTPNEFKDFVGNEAHRVIQEILYGTGEDYIYFESCDLNIHSHKERTLDNCDDLYKYAISFNIYHSQLESDKEYLDRLKQLQEEEAQLKDLATKFGYELKKIDE